MEKKNQTFSDKIGTILGLLRNISSANKLIAFKQSNGECFDEQIESIEGDSQEIADILLSIDSVMDDRLSTILTFIAYDLVGRHHGDIILDIPQMMRLLNAGEDVNIFARRTGCDLEGRFRDCFEIEEKCSATFKDVVEKAKRSLGVDWIIRIHPDFSAEFMQVSEDAELIDKGKSFLAVLENYNEIKIEKVESLE